MTIDESTVRRELQRQADSVRPSRDLADRIVGYCTALDPVDVTPAGPSGASGGSRSSGISRGADVVPLWRNWLVPVLAAACVALLIAVGLVGRDYLKSSGTAGRPVNPATHNLPVAPPLTHAATATPSPGATGSSGPTGTGSGSVGIPSGFTVRDLTFVSLDEGWALGSHGCTDVAVDCATTLAHTSDGGRSWSGLPTPPWDGTQVTDVEHVRFADSRIGYAFSSSALYLTTDGGRSWQLQSGGAWGLEVANGIAVRVLGQGACAPGCQYRVERSAVGSTSWQSVSLPPGAFPVGAQLVRTGHVLALATYGNPAGGSSDAIGALFVSTDDGASWQLRTPCVQGAGQRGEVDLTSISLAPDGTLAALCVGRMAGQGPGSSVRESTDNGVTFSSRTPSLGQIQPGLVAAASAGVLFYEYDALYRWAPDAGTQWQRTGTGGHGPAGASFVGFQTPTVGRVVQAGTANGVVTGSPTIWTTTDAGRSWTAFTFR